jgi:hypothetical protein
MQWHKNITRYTFKNSPFSQWAHWAASHRIAVKLIKEKLVSSIKSTSLCCDDCDRLLDVQQLHSPVKLELLEAGGLGGLWWRCFIFVCVLCVVVERRLVLGVLCAMCMCAISIFTVPYFFLVSYVLAWYYNRYYTYVITEKTVKYTNLPMAIWDSTYDLFYLFSVNLSTKMSWNFNYETHIRRNRYVSHPVYWEATEIGK